MKTYRPPRPWMAWEEEIARDMNLTPCEVADRLDRSVQAVRSWRHRVIGTDREEEL